MLSLAGAEAHFHISLMSLPPPIRFSSLTHLIQQTAEKKDFVASQTPLTASDSTGEEGNKSTE